MMMGAEHTDFHLDLQNWQRFERRHRGGRIHCGLAILQGEQGMWLTERRDVLPIFLLVTMQPDLGSGLIYAFSGIFVLVVTGFPYYLFLYF